MNLGDVLEIVVEGVDALVDVFRSSSSPKKRANKAAKNNADNATKSGNKKQGSSLGDKVEDAADVFDIFMD